MEINLLPKTFKNRPNLVTLICRETESETTKKKEEREKED